jgi:hypothetical protein
MNPGKLLFFIFLGFTILACFGVWLDKLMGWEHHRALQQTPFSYWIKDGKVVKKQSSSRRNL